MHYRLTRLVADLGPKNTFVRFALTIACRQHKTKIAFNGDRWCLLQGKRRIVIAEQHFLYAQDLARYFDYYFNQVSPEKIGPDLVIDFSYPHVHKYVKSGFEFELSSFPEEESALEAYLEFYRPKAGDTVFDIGAYCGVSTHLFSTLVGDEGKVYAFEPDPQNYELLLRNIERHAMKNVVPLQMAVSQSTGTELFNCEGALGSGIAAHMSRASLRDPIAVETVTFEEACSRWSIPQFAKIDIEGAEVAMLKAAASFIARQRIFLALDTNHLVDGELTNAKVEEILKSSGYSAVSSDASGFMTTLAAPPSTAVGEP